MSQSITAFRKCLKNLFFNLSKYFFFFYIINVCSYAIVYFLSLVVSIYIIYALYLMTSIINEL